MKNRYPSNPVYNPEEYLPDKENDRQRRKERLFFALQDELHKILNDFLNGGTLSKRSKAFFPLLDKYKNTLNLIAGLIHSLQSEYGFGFHESLEEINRTEQLKFIRSSAVARIISVLYTEFYSCLDKVPVRRAVQRIKAGAPFSFWSQKASDISYLRPVFTLQNIIKKRLEPFLVECFLHGSLGTLDYIKTWSDVDTFIIVKKDTINDPVKLLELRKHILGILPNFFQIDSFQHHGGGFIAEQDMQLYPQHYLPFEVLGFAVSCLTENKEFTFQERDSKTERMSVFFEFCEYLKKVKFGEIILSKAFDWKGFYHSVLLLPALYLQAKDRYCYKKFSFDLARNDFDEKVWDVVCMVTKIRKEWKYKQCFPGVITNWLCCFPNPFLYGVLCKYLKRGLPEKIRQYPKQKLIENAYDLSLAMIDNISGEKAHSHDRLF